MQTIQIIIATIISIWNNIKSLTDFLHQKKIEKIQETELKKEEQKESKTIEDAVINKDIDKLNDLAGWKD